jgi:hypothetical protein
MIDQQRYIVYDSDNSTDNSYELLARTTENVLPQNMIEIVGAGTNE